MRSLALLSVCWITFSCANSSAISGPNETGIVKGKETYWHACQESNQHGERLINPSKYDCWILDEESLNQQLNSKESTVFIPVENKVMKFLIKDSGTMSPALAKKFPEIKSFKGSSLDNTYKIRLDKNKEGLFVVVYRQEKNLYISPLFKGNKKVYAVYNRESIPEAERPRIFLD